MATSGALPSPRLSINLSPKAYEDLKELAHRTSRSMTDVVRIGIGLVRIAIDAKEANEKLIVISADNRPLKEIVLPW